MAKKNLFETAKKAPEKKKGNNNVEVSVPKLEKTLIRMVEIAEKKAELDGEYAELDETIRTKGKEHYIKLYNDTQKNPGTLQCNAQTMCFQFITMDKYKKIDEERAKELRKAYGKEIVTEDTVYSFDTKVLEKHLEHISELLLGSDVLTDEDKENLITAVTSYTVTKGTINALFANKKVKEVESIIEDIQPQFNIKSIKEI